MSSTPSVTISLNTAGVSTPQKPDQTRDSGQLESSVEPSEFGDMVERAASPEDGKPLPQERDMSDSDANSINNGPYRTEVRVQHDISGTDANSIQVDVNTLPTRTEGRVKLVTGEQPITEDGLVAFMQSQGFSRSEIAELLMARKDESDAAMSEPLLTASDWLTNQHIEGYSRIQALEMSSPSDPVTTRKPLSLGDFDGDQLINLADALRHQLSEPAKPEMVSPIVSVVASRDMLSKLIGIETVVESNSSDHTSSKTLDLASLVSRSEGSQMSLTGQNTGQESSGQFERFEKAMGEMAQPGQKSQDFREFLAEHLRRADSLKELSERLGTFLAKQMSAQIGRGTWRLEMALHPAELGSIEVDMEMTERGLEASFKASQSVTRDLLMESMSRLKSWFEEGGIDVAYAGLTQDSGAETGGNSTSDDDSLDPGVDSIDDETSNVSETEQHEVQGTERLDIRV